MYLVEINERITLVFNCLHDGTISAWTGDLALLTLTVNCRYLAELLDPAFDSFVVQLSDITRFEMETWANPGIEIQIKTEPAHVWKDELEILSAEKENDYVKIAFNQPDLTQGYCGASLVIKASDIKIFDQQFRELSIEQLVTITNNY